MEQQAGELALGTPTKVLSSGSANQPSVEYAGTPLTLTS